jgi:hypothetical protein
VDSKEDGVGETGQAGRGGDIKMCTLVAQSPLDEEGMFRGGRSSGNLRLPYCENNRDNREPGKEVSGRKPNARPSMRRTSRMLMINTGIGSSLLHQASSRLLGGRYFAASCFEAPRGKPRRSART